MSEDIRGRLKIGQTITVKGTKDFNADQTMELTVVALSEHLRCPVIAQAKDGTAFTFLTNGVSQLGYYRIELPPRKVKVYYQLYVYKHNRDITNIASWTEHRQRSFLYDPTKEWEAVGPVTEMLVEVPA